MPTHRKLSMLLALLSVAALWALALLIPAQRLYLLGAAWVTALSAVTFVCYAHDKRSAIQSKRRVRERTLHGLAALGGWPGALLAQPLLKHKTVKRPFQRMTVLIVTLHLISWSVLGLYVAGLIGPR